MAEEKTKGEKVEQATKQEREKNVELVKKQIMYAGLKTDVVDEQVAKMVNARKKKDFSYTIKDVNTQMDNTADFTLNFKKADNGKIYFNNFKTTLKEEGKPNIEHTFPIKFKGISARESINLLEGRSVKTQMKDFNTDKVADAFVQFKLEDSKNQYDNYKMNVVFADRINVKNTLVGSKLKMDNDEINKRTIKSLEKGNITDVIFNNKKRGKAILNPKENKLDLYDLDMNKLDFRQTLAVQENKSKQQIKH